MKLTGMSAFSTVNWNLPNLNPFPDETSFSCKLRLMSAFSTVLENAWSSISLIELGLICVRSIECVGVVKRRISRHRRGRAGGTYVIFLRKENNVWFHFEHAPLESQCLFNESASTPRSSTTSTSYSTGTRLLLYWYTSN